MTFINEREFGSLIEPSKIASSVSFPVDLMKKHLSPGDQDFRKQIWDAGCGFGLKHDELVSACYSPHGVDMNQKAVNAIRSRTNRFATQSNIIELGSGEMGLQMIGWIETVEGVLWQALGPSLVGQSWEKALNTLDLIMKPDGCLFVADFLRPDLTYEGLDAIYDQEANARQWRKRMEINYEAFSDLVLDDGTPFPYGTVAVARPGKYKRVFDWCDDPKTLRTIFNLRGLQSEEDVFERFAQNLDLNDFTDHLTNKLKYRELERKLVWWPSRSPGSWYPGFIAVYKKPGTYRYDPFRYGLSPDEDGFSEQWKRVKHAIPEAIYWTTYFGLLRQSLHQWDNHQPKIDELALRMYEAERAVMKQLF